MSKYDDSNSGTLGKNKNKREGKKHPDYSGRCKIDGVPYWISGWIRSGERGQFLSLSFQKREEKSSVKNESKPDGGKVYDDDIPF